jgi:16S rRNA (adenine1518-N6/adenine1519-N6)-dimethyltransferase
MTSKPKLGQNFLNDPSASLAIVEALGDISASTVVEIGPGKGAITRLLANRAHQLVAVEVDAILSENLVHEYASSDHVQVIQRDILTIDLANVDWPKPLGSPREKLVIVGNLPYYITSQILLHLFEYHHVIDRAVIMVQREVAERIAAQPGHRDYGMLTATTQLYARVDNLFTLPPTSFSPPPDVHSTVLRLTFEPRFQQLCVNPPEFIAFLKKAFAQKRKTLANNLRFAGIDREVLEAAFEATQISPDIRAEALPLEDAARLSLALQQPTAI